MTQGVYEPECDFYGEDPAGPTGYPDTQEFLAGMQENVKAEASILDQPEPEPEPEQQQQPALQLAGDYAGLGGPKTVPLYSPQAFERPPVTRTILDEIFLEPTEKQLDNFYRVINKSKVYDCVKEWTKHK